MNHLHYDGVRIRDNKATLCCVECCAHCASSQAASLEEFTVTVDSSLSHVSRYFLLQAAASGRGAFLLIMLRMLRDCNFKNSAILLAATQFMQLSCQGDSARALNRFLARRS